jgi:S1-C subfamily serine protease
MTLHLRFAYLFATIVLLASPARAASGSMSVAEAGAMGEFRPGSEIRGNVQANPDGLKGAASGSYFGKQAGQILSRVRPDREVRGAKEAQIYKRFSRSVVLVLTKDGLGTGTLVSSSGDIITNFHVIKGAKDVGVIFKPVAEGQNPTKADLLRAKIIKVDEVADLALIRVEKVPAGIEPITIGDKSDVSVGDDVHAIGHPTGEAWTYTRGVVSQIRAAYEWTSSTNEPSHKANVIQTQTPINPGNSGGPLLTSTGKLAGINSFKSKGEGLNFAIANDEVRRFINTAGDRLASKTTTGNEKIAAKDGECEAKEIYRGNSKDDSSAIIGIDTDCDGKAEIEIRTPYDIRKPITLVVDENKDGKTDMIIFDTKRKGKWEFSFRDTNFDGKWDLECEHETGELEPTRCVPYREKTGKE